MIQCWSSWNSAVLIIILRPVWVGGMLVHVIPDIAQHPLVSLSFMAGWKAHFSEVYCIHDY